MSRAEAQEARGSVLAVLSGARHARHRWQRGGHAARAESACWRVLRSEDEIRAATERALAYESLQAARAAARAARYAAALRQMPAAQVLEPPEDATVTERHDFSQPDVA